MLLKEVFLPKKIHAWVKNCHFGRIEKLPVKVQTEDFLREDSQHFKNSLQFRFIPEKQN